MRHFARLHPATRGLIVPAPTTDAGTTATLIDTKLGRGGRDANYYDGCTVLMVSGTQAGDIAAVDDAGFNTVSQLTFSPAMGGSGPGSGDNYVLLPPGLSPEEVREEINRVLRESYGPHLWYPSIIPDSDFENADQATDWPVISTPTTNAFVTTAASVFLGERVLHVVADGAAEGIRSLSVEVTKAESIRFLVFCRAVSGTLQVAAYDATGSANLGTPPTHDEQAWTEVRFTESMAAAQELLQMRFTSTDASGEFYISANVIAQPQSPRVYIPPPWFRSEAQFVAARYLPAGQGSQDTNTYLALDAIGQPAPTPAFLPSDNAVNPLMVQLDGATQDPIVIVAKRDFAELATDAATSHIHREYLVKKAIGNIHRERGEPDVGSNGSEAARLADSLNYGRGLPVWEEGRMVSVR